MNKEFEQRAEELIRECRFTSSRSQGPGGQNVNKVNSRVELKFSIPDSRVLSDEEKILVGKKLRNRITVSSELHLTEQGSRSQLKNKKELIARFLELIEKALRQPVKRIPTKAGQASVEKRLERKKLHSVKKALRKTPPDTNV